MSNHANEIDPAEIANDVVPSSPRRRQSPWNPVASIGRSFRWAAPVGLLLACFTAFAIALTFQPRYRASHLLESANDYVVHRGVKPSIKNLATSEEGLIKSPIVIQPLLADPGVFEAIGLPSLESAEASLLENLTVEAVGPASRMKIAFEAADPEASALVANKVAESYLSVRGAFDNRQMDSLVRGLEPELRRQEQVVEDKHLIIQKLRGSLRYDVSHQVDRSGGLSLHQRRLDRLISRMDELKIRIGLIDEMKLSESNRRLSGSKKELVSFNSTPSPDNKASGESSKTELDSENERRLRVELRLLQEMYGKENAIAERLDSFPQLLFAEQELQLEMDVLKKLRERLSAIELESRYNQTVRSLAPAVVPTAPVQTLPTRRIAIASVGAFALPFLLSFLWGIFSHREEH